jgi:F0F1-type ATP synthase membrane subunit b/b'
MFDIVQNVPRFTEAKIQQLCTEAITVRTSEDVERVIGELREALELHIRLARESLEAQVSALTVLDSHSN